MKMELEKYLTKNRLRLDVDEPDNERIWERINSGLKKDRQLQSNWFWKIAAVFLFGVLTTYVVVKETSKEQVVIITLGDISKELGQREAELKQVVNTKWKEIEPLTQEQKTEFQFLLNELNELDEVYKTYEKDLYITGENEQIINVLLDYYEKKIRILNRLSLEIQKQKNNENNITL
ncbi:MAG: hypothetical protein R2757_10620 [Draconibacterium sp.]